MPCRALRTISSVRSNMAKGFPLLPPKATVIADSPALACHIRTALGPRGGMPCASATNTGVDAVGGRSRCAARHSTRAAKTARGLTRRTRL